MSFVEIEHTADRAIRVTAENLTDLFVDAACGMYSLMGIHMGNRREVRSFHTEQPETESLLIWFLSELLVISELEHLAGINFDLHIEAGHLDGSVELSDIQQQDSSIKAVTYSGLAIKQDHGRIESEIVFDF